MPRVLVAEDDKTMASLLLRQLDELGYEVVGTVTDGQAAVDACRQDLPDLALLDIEMPGLDGLTAAREINTDPGTPVIILTAHDDPQFVHQAIQEGVIQYLLKPVTAPGLNAAIQTALARSSEIKELRDNVASLESTLRERKLIERAKGILQARRNLTEPEAFRFLQRQSQDRRIPMSRLAEMIVQADELI